VVEKPIRPEYLFAAMQAVMEEAQAPGETYASGGG